ncbi:MAG: carboxypeptidase regulatory-like domain-containing protein [Treponema sp.]|nr:carboxypeptidase regulatory-like domain-containing protein [Treponema sp.]
MGILLLFVSLFFSCKTAEFGHKVIDVNGMIYDFSNRPVPAFSVTLDEKYSIDTDINGRFTLSKIPLGTYTITAKKPGYETYLEEIDIKDFGQIVYIRVPSQSDLLDLADQALANNNLDLAEDYARRAYNIDSNNIEMLFYYATITFRKGEYDNAVGYLVLAQSLGSQDEYVVKFLSLLREFKDDDETIE